MDIALRFLIQFLSFVWWKCYCHSLTQRINKTSLKSMSPSVAPIKNVFLSWCIWFEINASIFDCFSFNAFLPLLFFVHLFEQIYFYGKIKPPVEDVFANNFLTSLWFLQDLFIHYVRYQRWINENISLSIYGNVIFLFGLNQERSI